MKIIIRAEGGNRIGMGHVMRMLVLAGKLKAFAEVVFVCRDSEEFLAGINYIEGAGYFVFKADSGKMLASLCGIEADCMITDSYDVDEDYFDITKDCFKITGCMDDLNKNRINTDFIINKNIYANDLKYKTGKGTRLFTGTKYLLLREEFVNIEKKVVRDSIRDVLITLGGADPGNLSEEVALKFGKSFPYIKFHVAAGPSFSHRDSLNKIAGGNILIHHNSNMSELMQKCDAAISACGSTVYELCACGTPAIGIVTADNQIMTAGKMESLGALKYSGGPEEAVCHLKNLNYEERVKMSETGRGLADGYGSRRLAEEIKNIIVSRG